MRRDEHINRHRAATIGLNVLYANRIHDPVNANIVDNMNVINSVDRLIALIDTLPPEEQSRSRSASMTDTPGGFLHLANRRLSTI
jgi:hypothetical protein